jgi:hypothetical protein
MQKQKITEQLTRIKAATAEAENALQSEDKTGKRERISKAGWLPQAIYLPPAMRHKLRVTASDEEREIGEIVNEALAEYFKQKRR